MDDDIVKAVMGSVSEQLAGSGGASGCVSIFIEGKWSKFQNFLFFIVSNSRVRTL